MDERKKNIKEGKIPKPTFEQEREYRQQIWKENAQVNFHTDGDPLGTAAIYNTERIEKYLLDVEQFDSRNISVVLKTQIGKMTFTCTHSPQAGTKDKNLQEKQTLEKQKYYDNLRKIHEKYGRGPDIHYLGGDFNVRLILRTPAEENIIGPFIHTKEDATLDNLTEQQKENRDFFMEFCTENQYLPMNTWFQKENDKLITYRTPHRAFFLHHLLTLNILLKWTSY